MQKNYLAPKKPIGIEPAADVNVESIGPCCLDINSKTADLVKGRGAGVWLILMLMLMLLFTLLPIFFGLFANMFWQFFQAAIVGYIACLWLDFRFIRAWRNHFPMRFNRQTRKVYFHHKGKTYISDWDSIRAYFYLLRGVTYNGVPTQDEQINIEFLNSEGKTYTVYLLGTRKAEYTGLDGAKALWEYIRIYMEDGPEALPPPEPWIADATSTQEILKQNNPFPIHADQWWFWPIEIALFFPIRAAFFILAYPTDLIYYYLVPHIKVKPFPPELADPCRCSETETQRDKRVTSLLSSYESQITANDEAQREHQQVLLKLYHAWFVDFKPYGTRDYSAHGALKLSLNYRPTDTGDIEFLGRTKVKIVNGIPEEWQRVKLIEIAELNPTYHGMKGKELCQIPIDLLPRQGFFLDQDRLENFPTPHLSNICRNEDTLFPATVPWLTQNQPAFVQFLQPDELATCSGDIIVMRTLKVNSAFIYCLASSQVFRDYAEQHIIETAQGPRVSLEALANFEILMPPPVLFETFNLLSQFHMNDAISAAKENYWLKRARNRLLTNAPWLPDGKK